MEGFLTINWDKAVDESSSFFSRDVFDNCSAAFHAIHRIPQSPWPHDEQGSMKNNSRGASGKTWSPCHLKRIAVESVGGQGKTLKIQPPAPFPRKSVLNVFEQKDYLFAIIRVMRSFMIAIPADADDFIRIKEMQIKLRDEIQEFQKLAQTIMENNPSAYLSLNPGIARYVNEMWKTQLASVHLYPSFYKLIGNIILVPKENMITLDMTLERTVLELGRIPCQIFPPLNTLIKIQRNYKIINNRYPANVLESEQMSNDENAVKLATKYGVKIVVSAKALRSLAGNVGPLFRRSWDIPFTIKEVNFHGEVNKVIFIDEPLPPSEMSAVEKNALFNRMAIKCQFSNVNRSRFFVYTGSGKKYEYSESAEEVPGDIFSSDNTDLDILETFGIEKRASSSSKICTLKVGEAQQVTPETGNTAEAIEVTDVEKQQKPFEHDFSTATDSDSSEMSLVIDTGSECGQSPRKRSKNASKNIKSHKKFPNDTSNTLTSIGTENQTDQQNKNKVPEPGFKVPIRTGKIGAPNTQASLLSDILQNQEKMMQSHRKPSPKKNTDSTTSKENPQEYTKPKKDENLTYRIWNLQANEKSIRLLVRSSVDTAIVTSSGEFRTFLMIPKTEYQPWFGGECLSTREMNEQWIDLHLRPECKLVRIRLDAYTGDFLMCEQKDAACLEAEISFQYGTHNKPANSLQTIWAVLSSLCDLNLSPGQFLLRHGFHDGMCIQVWESTGKESSSLDLHKIYNEIDPTANAVRDVSENWSALDPCAVFPIQRALNRPPLTFEPTEDLKKTQIKRKADGGKKKNTKKKKQGAAKDKL
ncbi:hypothetical protein OUZ56_008211 [Daphnia magna]|uniref:Little elongation complex subunit 2 C-terminal domain-containing protein n=1 Tax=Daphnia magna TaxID=35525 RepID=A0ABR0ACJ6_9CRUS|nr:hypothetical protein OUZ56_008211 [Daphnia magna]